MHRAVSRHDETGADRKNLGAPDLALTPEVVKALTAAADAMLIEGARYPEQIEKTAGL